MGKGVYAVAHGRAIGIYGTWAECEAQIDDMICALRNGDVKQGGHRLQGSANMIVFLNNFQILRQLAFDATYRSTETKEIPSMITHPIFGDEECARILRQVFNTDATRDYEVVMDLSQNATFDELKAKIISKYKTLVRRRQQASANNATTTTGWMHPKIVPKYDLSVSGHISAARTS